MAGAACARGAFSGDEAPIRRFSAAPARSEGRAGRAWGLPYRALRLARWGRSRVFDLAQTAPVPPPGRPVPRNVVTLPSAAFALRRLRARLAAACALVLTVSACAALPEVPDHPAQRASEPVRVEGARGPMSKAQSDAVLERLDQGDQPTDIFRWHLAHEEAITGSPLVAGNRVQLLQDGPQTYEAMFKAIGAARDHVNVETYILEDDEVGRRFAELLIGRQRAGVQVHLIHDAVGTLGTPREFFERLKAAGVQVLEYNPVNPSRAGVQGWDPNERDHRKLVVVDGRVAFLGGINISSVYSGSSFGKRQQPTRADGALPWRDTHLQVEGPVVAELQKVFLATWERQAGRPAVPRQYFPKLQPVGREVVRAVATTPAEQSTELYQTLLSAIDSARTEVLITNAYFAPDPQMLAALKKASARGVDVQLLLPSKTDSWLIFHAGRSYYEGLLAAGVRIHERRGALLHAKTAVIDGVWSTVGSANLDWRSFLHNQELNAVVLGADFGRRMREVFFEDLKQSQAITAEQWRRRSPWLRVQEGSARLWEYWL
jgi:cardiolipin synthase